MTVSELIEELRKYPGDMELVEYVCPDRYMGFNIELEERKLYQYKNDFLSPKEYPPENGEIVKTMLCI
jgi:hypothetical protein